MISEPACPPDTATKPSGYMYLYGKYYKPYTYSKTWLEAMLICQNEGAWLVEMKTADELAAAVAIRGELGPRSARLG